MVARVSIDVLVEPRVDGVSIIILLHLLLSRRMGGRGVCGEAGSSWTRATTAWQEVGLQPGNDTSTCTQVTQSTAPGGLKVPHKFHSEDRMRTSQTRRTPIDEQ